MLNEDAAGAIFEKNNLRRPQFKPAVMCEFLLRPVSLLSELSDPFPELLSD